MSSHKHISFLGRTLGTMSGWDGDPGEVWWVYDFEPKEGIPIPACRCLQFDELKGNFHIQDDDGNDAEPPIDMVSLLAKIAKD